MTKTETEQLLWDVHQTSKALGVSERTLWRLTHEGEDRIPHLKINRLVRYSKTDVQDWIARQTQGG